MKSIRLIALLLFSVLFSFACSQQTGSRASDPAPKPEDGESKIVTVEEAAKNAFREGQDFPAFDLPDSGNKRVRSADLLKKSNLVVVFYRGGWCPYCNLYLKKLQGSLDEIKANGGELVAISAENPDDSLSTGQKNSLDFYVLSDKDLNFARQLGLVYQLPKETDEKYKGMGIDIVGTTEMEKPELPISATFVVNSAGKIVYSFIDPDYKKRAEPETVITVLKKIKAEQ